MPISLFSLISTSKVAKARNRLSKWQVSSPNQRVLFSTENSTYTDCISIKAIKIDNFLLKDGKLKPLLDVNHYVCY